MSDAAYNPIHARGYPPPTDAPQGFRALALRRTYNTAHHDLAQDFFIPLLSRAITYDRGVGYFSSGWLRVHAQGLAELAVRGGRARWVTSPLLSQQDLAAFTRIARLEEHKPCLDRLFQTVDELRTALETDTRNTMAWMVADGRLEFRLAIPVAELIGDFHDKFGVFCDPYGHRVSFLGSYNDTPHGLGNYESIRVFFSWHVDTADAVADDEQRFTRIWLGREPNLRIFELPEAVRARILALRTQERPYPLLSDRTRQRPAIRLPGILPRDYQKDALAAWIENDRRGILDMATGTGKTIVALEALTHCEDVGFVVIAAPTTALVAQWLHELDKLEGLRDPIEVSNRNPRWPEQIWPRLRLGAAQRDHRRPFVAVGTYHSLSSERFLSILDRVHPASGTGLLVADEVHHTGAPTRQQILSPYFAYRLGLTATLDQAYDPERTQAIEDYFEGVVYRLAMDQAVGSILCRYRYDLHFVELTEAEFAAYQKLTQRIWRVRHRSPQELDEPTDSVELLNILLNRRARIVKLAAAKLELLSHLISQITINKCLIYCADLEQLRAVQDILAERGVAHLPYTYELDPEARQTTLEQLNKSDIRAVIAVKCLDEGVDVPQVHQAILLASSTSEREFVQRRGRILRQAPGKQAAHLIDVLTIPPKRYYAQPPHLLLNELERARILARAADNRFEAELELCHTLSDFGIPVEETLGVAHAG